MTQVIIDARGTNVSKTIVGGNVRIDIDNTAVEEALAELPMALQSVNEAIDKRLRFDQVQSLSPQELRNALTSLSATLIPIEALGGLGDYNPTTQTGTDNSPAFALARALGVGVQLKANAKYLISDEITTYSGMRIVGDEGYTPEIYPKFPGAGYKMIHSPPLTASATPDRQKDIVLRGFKLMRMGQNAEHGCMVSNVDGLLIDIQVLSTGAAPGGAIGVSTFFPDHLPSTNVIILANRVTNGGNYGVQVGNVDKVYIEGTFEDCVREVIGLEPYALNYYNFTSANVTGGETINKPGHGLKTGDPIAYSRQGETSITGMSRVAYYFAIRVDADNFKVASTKLNAFAGVALPIGAFTGTHRIYACGTLSRCIVGPVQIVSSNVPTAGSTTGTFIITASSCGYHEDIVVLPPSVTEQNNTTSGHAAITVVGAQGISLNGLVCSGQKNSGLRVTPATLKGLDFFVAGSKVRLDPSNQDGSSFAASVIPSATLRNIRAREFGNIGIYVEDGEVIIENCDVRSSTSTKAAIGVTASARARGSRVRNNTVHVPNGVGVALVDSAENVLGPLRLGETGTFNLARQNVRRDTPARAQADEIGEATILDVSITPIVSLCAADGTTDTYTGTIYVQAWQNDVGNSNHAAYLLHVGKGFAAGTATVSQISSTGLVDGGSSSRPSFTFSMSGNNLIATPIGSTSAARASGWFFKWRTQGDLATTNVY